MSATPPVTTSSELLAALDRLRSADFVWTPELVDKFLADPQAPPFRGNRMPFAGMPDAKARADLVAYLKEASP